MRSHAQEGVSIWEEGVVCHTQDRQGTLHVEGCIELATAELGRTVP